MSANFQKWIGVGALFIGLAIAAGAFGAHLLQGRLDDYSLKVFEKAAFYHAFQGVGLMLVAIAAEAQFIPALVARRALWLLVFGIVVFSGSLYLLALSGERHFGMITPIGGLAFLAAWFSLAWALLRNRSSEDVDRS